MSPATLSVENLEDAFSNIPVLPGMSAWEYLEACRARQPEFYRLLKPSRVSAKRTADLFAEIAGQCTHFESKLDGGRGDQYRETQNKNFLVRAVAFQNIFELAWPGKDRPSGRPVVLDALGGNGTMTRILRASRPLETLPLIVTSDVSGRQIESAFSQGLPAVRLPAQDLIWFADETFNAVLVAYGTHHIAPEQRHRALSEAFRVLKPGGRVVLQDFEIGSPTTGWYENVLDRWTLTGHKHRYFTRQDFRDLLSGNAFADVEVKDVYDPFILYADEPAEARRQLLEYVFTLFALEKLVPSDGKLNERLWTAVEAVVRETSTFTAKQLPQNATAGEFTVTRDGSRYRAEIPRVCLAATARKP